MSQTKSTIELGQILSEFDPEYNQLVELGHQIGVEKLNTVLDIFGGEKPHIPMAKNFWAGLGRRVRDNQIKMDFKGNNHKDLAAEHGLKERQIRNILESKNKTYKRPEYILQSCKMQPDDHDIITALTNEFCGAAMHDILHEVIKEALKDSDLIKILNRKYGTQATLQLA